MIIHGTLSLMIEYGTTSVIFGINDSENEEFYVLKDCDHLKIYDKDDNMFWENNLTFEKNEKQFYGYDIPKLPKHVNYELFLGSFQMKYKATLVKRD